MPKRGDDFGLLLAGGILLGIGLLAASSSQASAEERRKQFEVMVRNLLAPAGLLLTRLALGRGRGNEPFWDVTVQNSAGEVWTERARLQPNADPLTYEAAVRVRDVFLAGSATVGAAR